MSNRYLSLDENGNTVLKREGLVYLDEDGNLPAEMIDYDEISVYQETELLFPGETLELSHPERGGYSAGLMVLIKGPDENWQAPSESEHDLFIPYREDEETAAVKNESEDMIREVRLIAW